MRPSPSPPRSSAQPDIRTARRRGPAAAHVAAAAAAASARVPPQRPRGLRGAQPHCIVGTRSGSEGVGGGKRSSLKGDAAATIAHARRPADPPPPRPPPWCEGPSGADWESVGPGRVDAIPERSSRSAEELDR
ncbi:uncharacterized protein LOC144333151 isoform X2 [Macaca mulatta]